MLAATVTPLLFFVEDGLVLLPVLLEVEDVEDDEVEEEEEEEEDFEDVACSLALLEVEFVVELVPGMVIFAMLPELIVEFILAPVVVEFPEEAVELLLDLDPEATTGAATPLVALEEAVEEVEGAVAEPVEAEARAATASVGQVEQPPKS